MDQPTPALRRIVADAGVDALLDVLAERIPRADLTTLLLAVMERRTTAMTAPDIFPTRRRRPVHRRLPGRRIMGCPPILTCVGTRNPIGRWAPALTEDVPNSLDAVNAAMPQLIRTAGVIDSTMRALSFLGVDYDPDAPLDESLAIVQEELAAVPPDLRDQREGLEDVSSRLDDLAGQSGNIATDLTTITADLEASRELVEGYRATATEGGLLVDDLSERLTTQSRTARIVIPLLALAVALGQTVPLVLGLQVLRRPTTTDPGPA